MTNFNNEYRADPSPILHTITGLWAARMLVIASKLGIPEALAEEALSEQEIAARLGIPEHSARLLADALRGMGLAERIDGKYSNTAAAQQYLAGDPSSPDMRGYIRFVNAMSFGHWQDNAFDVLSTGTPNIVDMNADFETFIGGVTSFAALQASLLAEVYDFSSRSSVLDLGGSGVFLQAAMRTHTHLTATHAASPGPFAKAAEKLFAAEDLVGRVDVVEVDVPGGLLPSGHDVVLLKQILHRMSPEVNREIFTQVRAASEPGTEMLILDYYFDGDGEQRMIDSRFAGEFFVFDATVVYAMADVEQWLRQTGWKLARVTELPGCTRILVAEAV